MRLNPAAVTVIDIVTIVGLSLGMYVLAGKLHVGEITAAIMMGAGFATGVIMSFTVFKRIFGS
jgi:hypothetical protein